MSEDRDVPQRAEEYDDLNTRIINELWPRGTETTAYERKQRLELDQAIVAVLEHWMCGPQFRVSKRQGYFDIIPDASMEKDLLLFIEQVNERLKYFV